MHQLTRCALLALNTTHPLSVQRMPAISDHNILPDMGRMTARLHLAARTTCSRAPIATAKLNDVEPFAYLRDILERMSDGHPMSRIDDLLPWNWPKIPVNQ